MGKQIIISVGREFGSGGHEIAEKLAKHYDIPLYGKEIFEHVEENGAISVDVAKYFDEKPVNPIFYPIAFDGNYLPLEQTVANHIFDFIRKKGVEEQESFVIVGRCAESVLSDRENVLKIFIHADMDFRIARVMDEQGVTKSEATSIIKKYDKKRAAYHNYYSDTRWGSRSAYDFCLNSSIGIDTIVDIIVNAVQNKIK